MSPASELAFEGELRRRKQKATSMSARSASPAKGAPQYAPVTLTPSDPTQRFVAESALELLLGECVDAFHRDIAAGAALGADGMTGSLSKLSLAGGAGAVATVTGPGVGKATRTGPAQTPEDLDELNENEREQTYYKLESMGYRVGMAFVERCGRDHGMSPTP